MGDRASWRKKGGGLRALLGARAARAGERTRNASENERSGGATRTVATVRHEREQGDERVSEAAIAVMERRRPERNREERDET